MKKTMNMVVGALTAIYPSGIITMRSALVVLNYLPWKENDLLDLCFPRGSRKKNDQMVRPWILPPHLHKIGAIWVNRFGYPFLVYDEISLCILYLINYQKISNEDFDEAKKIFQSLINNKKINVAEIKNRIYLYPSAISLLNDFDRYILAVA